jgi:glycosyltransferase involved in cell wall biosynthesis
LADPEVRADLSRRGRERVLAHYTQSQVAMQTYQVYQAVVSSDL